MIKRYMLILLSILLCILSIGCEDVLLALFKDSNDEAINYVWQGDKARNINNFDKAIYYYTKAIKVKDDHETAYFKRGDIYKKKRIFDKALKDYRMVCKLSSLYTSDSNTSAYFQMARIYSLKNDKIKALLYLEKTIEAHPEVYYKLELDDLDFNNIKSEKKFQDLKRKYFNNEKNEIQKRNIKLNHSINFHTKLINQYPKISYHYYNRAFSYYKKKDYNKALTDINKAIELTPNEAKYYYMASRINSLKNEKNKALFYLKKSIELDPKYEKRVQNSDFNNIKNDKKFQALKKKHLTTNKNIKPIPAKS